MKLAVIIVAAGKSTRMGSLGNKLMIKLAGRTPLEILLDTFSEIAYQIIIVCSDKLYDSLNNTIQNKVTLTKGGAERYISVQKGLDCLLPDIDLVAIHDAARPLVTRETIEKTIHTAKEKGAAIAAAPCKDTIKQVDEHHRIISTPDRRQLWQVHTPQVFRKDLIVAAYSSVNLKGVTDDASVVERFGAPVYVVADDYTNIKITTPEDIMIINMLLGENKCKE